jgi:hypothetical protein
MKQVADAFSSRGRTKLYRWLWDHFDELPPYQKYRVNWLKLTEALNTIPVNASDEKPLTHGMVRKTYERVAKDRDLASAVAKPKPTSAPVAASDKPQRVFQPPTVLHSHPNPHPAEPASDRPARKPMVLRPARTIGPTELPEDDGSKLPQPLHRIR